MSKVIPFTKRSQQQQFALNPAAENARKAIEKRFGVSFNEFMSSNRSEETQRKIDRAMLKETLKIASKHLES